MLVFVMVMAVICGLWLAMRRVEWQVGRETNEYEGYKRRSVADKISCLEV